jgi:hypothetical protein
MTLRTTLLVLAFAPVLAATDTVVKPETATPIEICASCVEVRLPLIPDDKSKIKIDEAPEVELVFLGAAPKDADKFSSKWIGQPFPRAIEITLDPSETKQAGTYDLYLNLQPHSDPGAGRLKIQLIRPAATIEAIPKLIINRTFWFIGYSSDSHPDLRVTETSKKSGVTISSVRQLSNSSIGTTPIGGTLDFVLDRHPEIKPGEQANIDYRLKNDFELGTATGTMRIDALQLANPVSFDFEVRSRVHWIYIGITIAVGLFISYLVKVKLQQRIEFDQAHLDAQRLVERITQEEGRHADPAFAAVYRNELDTLRQAMDADSAADINTAKLALDTAWHAALQAFAKKHQDQLDSLNKLRDVTNYDWLVPPEVARAVVDARTAQVEVAQLIDRDDLAAAENRRRAIIQLLGDQIQAAALNWQNNEQQILTVLLAGHPGISAANTAALTKPATDLLSTLRKVDGNTPLATPEQIQQTLSDLKFERSSAQQFFQWLSNTIQMERAEAQAQIPDPPPAVWNADTFAGALAAETTCTTFLRTLTDDPKVAELPRQLNAVHQAWTNALQNQFAAPPNALVQAQLDARNYVQATRIAFQQRSAPPGAAAALAMSPGPGFVPPEFQRDTAGAAALPVYAIHTLFQTIATPSPAVSTTVTDATTLRKEKRLQSLVIGFLLIVAGYGLQLSTFVGTFTDFSTLFFWAFALDLTVDQIGKLAKKA